MEEEKLDVTTATPTPPEEVTAPTQEVEGTEAVEEALRAIRMLRLERPKRQNTLSNKEVALIYYPTLSPSSATRALRLEIEGNPLLKRTLHAVGWSKGRKVLTPLQIAVIEYFIG